MHEQSHQLLENLFWRRLILRLPEDILSQSVWEVVCEASSGKTTEKTYGREELPMPAYAPVARDFGLDMHSKVAVTFPSKTPVQLGSVLPLVWR